MNQIEQLLNSKSGGIGSAAEVLASPLIQRLRDQEAQVGRKVSELRSRYGDRHPTMIKAIAELRDLRAGIEREVRKVEQSIRNELQVAGIGERTLKNALDQLEVKSRQEGTAEIRLRELQREATANELLYQNFLSRFKETSSQENLQQADARIISRAQVPIVASFPKKRLTVILTAVMSLFIGVVLVFLIEQMENSFRSSEEVEEATGLPAIGMIPLLTGIMDRRQMGRFMAHKPTSTVVEAVRNLRTSIMLSDVDHPPKVVCVTSSIPTEGKTTTAIWLAQNTAMSGQKVLLIDCDLRHPSVHRTLGLGNDIGLVELLSNTSSLEDAVIHDEESGLFVIVAKETHGNSMDLLASNHMKRLLDGVREHFDLIVLDAAPVLALSDARVVGKLADKVIYVIKWNATPRNLVQTGLRTAFDSKLAIAGLVLTQVNTRKHAKYGYGDYGHYYGKYNSYYNN